MTTQKCAACHRKALAGSYCPQHAQAHDSIDLHYKVWVDAYGDISRDDFMDKLSGMKETGSWVKEVIEVEKKK